MNVRVPRRRPELWLLAVAGATLVTVLLNAIVQSWKVPDVMRFVPADNSAYVFSSTLRGLWTASEPHLARFLQDDGIVKGAKPAAQRPPLSGLGAGIRESLRKWDMHLSAPDDLASVGIDPDRAAAAAYMGDGRDLILIIPVADEKRLVDALAKVLEVKAVEEVSPPPSSALPAAMRKLGDWYLAFPGSSTAVLGSSEDALLKALARTEGNLDYFRSLDDVLGVFAELLPGRPAGWLKGSVDLGAFFGVARFALGFAPDNLVLSARLSLPTGASRLLTQVVTPGSTPLHGLKAAVGASNMTLVLSDPALPDYLAFLRQAGVDRPRSVVETRMPAFWDILADASSARRIEIAVASDARGVPDVLVGMAMDPAEAEKLVFTAQSKVRLQRDERILKAALRARAQGANTTENLKVSAATLVDEGLLSRERDPFWGRYRSVEGPLTPVPALTKADFAGSAYARVEEGGMRFTYILPPMTDDDFRYRVKEKEPERGSVEDLKADRFRLGSIYSDGMLWLANDADTLSRSLSRRAEGAARPDFDAAMRLAGANTPGKAVLYLQPRQLLEQTLLHPSREVNEQGRLYLSDLSHYRAILLAASATPSRAIHVGVQFLRY